MPIVVRCVVAAQDTQDKREAHRPTWTQHSQGLKLRLRHTKTKSEERKAVLKPTSQTCNETLQNILPRWPYVSSILCWPKLWAAALCCLSHMPVEGEFLQTRKPGTVLCCSSLLRPKSIRINSSYAAWCRNGTHVAWDCGRRYSSRRQMAKQLRASLVNSAVWLCIPLRTCTG